MIRRLLALAAATAISAGAFGAGAIAPPAASGAQPNWDMVVLTLPGASEAGGVPTVGPNRPFLHRLTITNGGPSNIPQLYLQQGDATYPAASATPSQGTCETETETGPALSCSFGALAPNAAPVVVNIVYYAPASGSVAIDYVTTTVGASEQGGASRGYSLSKPTLTQVDSSGNFDGKYFAEGDDASVNTIPTLSLDNPHSTKLVAPGWAVAATVADTTSTLCPVTTCIGQASELKLYGTPSANPSTFSVVIGFHASELPRRISHANLRLYHYPDSGPGYEIPACGRVPVAPCFTAVKLRDGSVEATVSLLHNGLIRGWN